ncbi:MAG: sulfur oxidation c-type cytochrome SoxX [Polaromonas sp.]|jgi:sulfur-oxidizing protein SoxX|nr:sulfur oxidation c-type cytochrome SoxX [Polaromonas sp.]MBK7026907.1 sulfur oxidation c-type cytochrome SoxX [Polaromonas sp.]MBP6088360.1 sulfur oxidation c-type cytochrome SoxX [Polaromonas sp.]MBP6155394.1 sulfur oxidation c-type cytochrome SoxX [Polaromonas sp.]MBP7115293.1 sulfur oxidation c-type cytochrome SoxX [Polaromonas sp.]
MKKNIQKTLGSAALLALLSACSTQPSSVEIDKLTAEIVKASFRDQGIVKASVLNTDEANKLCSAAEVAGKELDVNVAKSIEAANLKLVKWPTDGKFVGDWKEGEKLAQSGRGMTWTDLPTTLNGGNCYNCHQIDKAEISFGTIGPSLYNYGKLRQVKDVSSPDSKAVIEYTWGKIWNSRAYNACSSMPRAGHAGIMTEAQVKHLVALLVDPKSPVNQ